VVAGAAALAVMILTAPTALARPAEYPIPLPGATGAEGIASGAGSTFYAGDLFAGDIFRGNVRTGAVEKFIDNPDGRMAVGLAADVPHGLLFVAGGVGGHAYVYSTRTGQTVATYQLSQSGFINDVAVTAEGAWFTDSINPALYFVPVIGGSPGDARTLALSGPAADVSGDFNNNGIQASPDGSALLVAHTTQGGVNHVDPDTGRSQTVAGVNVPNVDGILLEGRTLWAVRNFDNQIVQFQLTGDLRAGSLRATVTSELLQVPTTVARFGDRLATVNAKFDTGFPPTADTYEVVILDR
jgi:sugar lactone lactonase YvrE